MLRACKEGSKEKARGPRDPKPKTYFARYRLGASWERLRSEGFRGARGKVLRILRFGGLRSSGYHIGVLLKRELGVPDFRKPPFRAN